MFSLERREEIKKRSGQDLGDKKEGEMWGKEEREGMRGKRARKEAVRTTGTQSYHTNLPEVQIRNLRKPLREATLPFPRRTKAYVKYFEINGTAKQKCWRSLVWEESMCMALLLGCSRLVHDVYGVYKFTLLKWWRDI